MPNEVLNWIKIVMQY